jgi:hypothetical protein
MKLLKPMLAAVALGATLVVGNAQAAVMTLSPEIAPTEIGGSVDLELYILDLGGGTAPSLGFFKVDIGFDPAVVGFRSVTYSDLLGAVDVDTTTDTVVGTGTVKLDNFSLLFDTELDPLQPSNFLLATLTFDGLAGGESALTMSGVELGDAVGGSLTADTLNNAWIRVAAVPAPASIGLFAPLLLLLRRRRPNQAVVTDCVPDAPAPS